MQMIGNNFYMLLCWRKSLDKMDNFVLTKRKILKRFATLMLTHVNKTAASYIDLISMSRESGGG